MNTTSLIDLFKIGLDGVPHIQAVCSIWAGTWGRHAYRDAAVGDAGVGCVAERGTGYRADGE